MTTEVRRNEDRSRYEIVVDGEVAGFAEFHDRDGTVVFPHTVISPERRGSGLGDELVRHALDDVSSRDQKVEALCWFVAEFIDNHPEYEPLRSA